MAEFVKPTHEELTIVDRQWLLALELKIDVASLLQSIQVNWNGSLVESPGGKYSVTMNRLQGLEGFGKPTADDITNYNFIKQMLSDSVEEANQK